MRAGGTYVDICIRDISSRGMLVQTNAPPSRGAYIEICRPGRIIVARVVWTKERRFGITTRERMNVDAFVAEAANGGAADQASPATPWPHVDRRTARRPDVRQSAERSRHISAALEFGFILACSALAAVSVANAVHDSLSRPFDVIATKLKQ
jgi:hypothetical protein